MSGRPQYVDLSVFNIPAEQINWPQLLSWARQWDGIARIAMRVTEGTTVLDQHFAGYRAAAEANGVEKIIFYHFADPDLNAPADELAWFSKNLGDIRDHDEIMLDAEKDVSAFTSGWALAWITAAEQRYGIPPNIYASSSFIQGHLQDTRLAAFPLILAAWQYDPNEQPPCPAPWTQYSYLQYTDQATGIPGLGTAPVDADVVVGPIGKLTTPGTVVAHLPQSSQFEANESTNLCCPWSVSELRYAGRPGKQPIGTGEQVDQWADAEYTKYIGPNTSNDPSGSTTADIEQFLADAVGDGGTNALAYAVITGITTNSLQASDIANVHAVLDRGYAVLAVVKEPSVVRRDGTSPYAWNTAGLTHCFTIVGYSTDGYLYVADEANVTDTWPDEYSEAAIALQWACVIQLPWLPPIPSGDPINWSTTTMALPAGWTLKTVENEPRLFNPYTPYYVRGALLTTIENWPGGWESWNAPEQNEEQNPQSLEFSNPSLGPGVSQTFRVRRLEMVTNKGNTIISGWLGKELVYYKETLVPQLQQSLAQTQATIQQQAAQISQLQQQLAACQESGLAPNLQQAINTAAGALAPFVKK